MAFDFSRILANEVALVRLDGCLDDLSLVRERTFAKAGDSLVRVELYEHIVFIVAGVDEKGLQVRDLQIQRFGGLEAALERACQGFPGCACHRQSRYTQTGSAEACFQKIPAVHVRIRPLRFEMGTFSFFHRKRKFCCP